MMTQEPSELQGDNYALRIPSQDRQVMSIRSGSNR
jgi:hypothetical protein